jgi:hypothetical protein
MLHLTQKDWETISAVLMLTRDYDESERQDFLRMTGLLESRDGLEKPTTPTSGNT